MFRRATIWLGFAIPVLLASGVAWAYLRDRGGESNIPAAPNDRFERGSPAFDQLPFVWRVAHERERTLALDLLAWRDEEVSDSDALAELAGICESEAAERVMTIQGPLIIRLLPADAAPARVTATPQPAKLDTRHPCYYARSQSPTVVGAIALIDAMQSPPKRSAYDAPAIVRAELRNLRAWSERAKLGTQSDHDYVVRVCARVKAYDFDLVASPPDRETVDLWDTLTDVCGEISNRTDLALDDVAELIAALPTE